MTDQLLIIDDDAALGQAIAQGLGAKGYVCRHQATATQALETMAAQPCDLLLTDLRLEGTDGLELCARVTEAYPDVPVIVMTAFGNLDAAITAIRAGAYDFISKPVDLEVLDIALKRALRHRALHSEVRRLREAAGAHAPFEQLLGESAPMEKIFDLMDRVARAEVPVLITGGTGTGKELVAQAIHARSNRCDGPFLALNCAAVPETLLEDELFGHLHGAYTGSRGPRQGLLQSARGGTVFLDEIGDMPLGLQPKLLRVLQERRFRPVGSDSEVEIDVRVLAATHHQLEDEIADGRFRQDLYYRLAVVQIELPLLRERGNDVLLLAQHFIASAAARAGKEVRGMSSAAAQQLLAYEWPGNVRELQNCVERAVVLARYDQITPEDLPDKLQALRSTLVRRGEPGELELLSLEEIERRHILAVLDHVNGKRVKAAELLGIDRKTLYRKLERWGFEVEEG